MHAKRVAQRNACITQHEGMHLHQRDTTFLPLRETKSFAAWGKDECQMGGIGLDAGNMGRGASTVGIASERVNSRLDGVNYGEGADPSVHDGFVETAPPN